MVCGSIAYSQPGLDQFNASPTFRQCLANLYFSDCTNFIYYTVITIIVKHANKKHK